MLGLLNLGMWFLYPWIKSGVLSEITKDRNAPLPMALRLDYDSVNEGRPES